MCNESILILDLEKHFPEENSWLAWHKERLLFVWD
jgi:hypothetical protein